jgi:branched-chain amino acid transport system substrate-binding protein
MTMRMAALAVVAATALTMTGCGATGSGTASTSPSPSNDPACQHYLAYIGPATGTPSALSFSGDIMGGIKLALSESPGSGLCVKDPYDTKAASLKEAGNASALARQIVADPSIIGVVGPSISAEAMVAGPVFSDAGVPMIAPSASSVALSRQGWRTWHRLVANDDVQGAAVAKFIKAARPAAKVFVVDDLSPYGKGLAEVVRKGLGANVVASGSQLEGDVKYAAIVAKAKSSGADVLFYAGYAPYAGPLVKQLRAAGWKGNFMSGGGSADAGFITTAGPAANGSVVTAAAGPPQRDFAQAFFALTGHPAGVYAEHAYDATKIYLAALKAGKTTRADVNAFIDTYTGQGLGGPIAFDAHGDLKESTIYAFTVQNGAFDLSYPVAIR